MPQRLQRGVLALLAAASLVALLVVSPGDSSRLSRAAEFALKVDASIDAMQKPEYSAADAELWVLEVSPFFSYEGLTPMGMALDPPFAEVEFVPQPDGMSHNHILGYTYCDGQVSLNARFVNPVSTWFNRDEFLGTLTHELIHNLGGGFCEGSSESLESRTQLATLEVLAAMANGGNKVALWALLTELRDIAMATVEYEALKAGDIGVYEELQALIFPGDAVEKSRFDKSMRFWEDDMDGLMGILDRYNARVFKDWQDFQFDVEIPLQGVTAVEMNDLKYVIENLDELAPPA